jgi:dipeptidyl aminopeptidase/acylaminoacyl peptidase
LVDSHGDEWFQVVGDVHDGRKTSIMFVSACPGGRGNVERITGAGKRAVLLSNILVSGQTTELVPTDDGKRFAYVHFDPLGRETLNLVNIAHDAARESEIASRPHAQDDPGGAVSWIPYHAAGRDRMAVLVSPRNRSGPTRLVVNVYPIVTAADSVALASLWPFPNLDYWLGRGYSVLYPELPVRSGSVREDIASGAVAALDAARAHEEALGSPICSAFLVGQSFGGYAGYVLAASGLKVDGVVIDAGTSNWNAFFGDLFASGKPYGSLFTQTPNIGPGGTPWTNPEGYRRSSPYYDLDKVAIPVLIGHGSDDQMDRFHAEMGYSALAELGKDVTLYMAKGGGHGPDTFTIDQQRTFLQLMNGFFDEHSRCDSTAADPSRPGKDSQPVDAG